jgi:hypothetical protein
MRLSRPCSPHFPITPVRTPPSAPLTSHPHRAFLSDFECAATSPYSTLPRLAIPVHRRPPAIIGSCQITAALHCFGDSHLRACFPSSPRLWCVAHLPHLLPHPQESTELAAGDHAPPPPTNVPAPGRTTASTVLRHSGELHCLPPCPTGRSCPAGTLSRLSSSPCRSSCHRW